LLSSFSAELATQDPASFPFNIRRIAGPPQAAIVARNTVGPSYRANYSAVLARVLALLSWTATPL